MADSLTYQTDSGAAIAEQNMQFQVIHRRPEYAKKEKEAVKADIEKRLFTVFCRYVRP